MPHGGLQQGWPGGRDARAPDAGDEPLPVRAVQGDGDRQPLRRGRQAHLVRAVNRVVRGDVQLLVDPRAALLVGVHQVGVALPVGVVHLGDHAGEGAVGAVAPVQGQRVEHVPEHPGVREHQHLAAAQVHAAGRSVVLAHADDSGILGATAEGTPLLMLLGATSLLSVPISDGATSYGVLTLARQASEGRFEIAEGGTIFLDEVGELPVETQIALLRVLQEHEFERVGGTGSIRTNVRVIAATNRDLGAAIAAGMFRSDLFYRLNVFPIEMPSLRNRKEDIPLLVEYFIDRYGRKAGKSFRTVSKKSLDLLQSYSWPGNIRELQNVIERSVIVCETGSFSVDESWISRQPMAPEPTGGVFRKTPSQEKEIIEAALRECEGRVYGPSGAASRLGIPRSTLESKIRALKINKSYFETKPREGKELS